MVSTRLKVPPKDNSRGEEGCRALLLPLANYPSSGPSPDPAGGDLHERPGPLSFPQTTGYPNRSRKRLQEEARGMWVFVAPSWGTWEKSASTMPSAARMAEVSVSISPACPMDSRTWARGYRQVAVHSTMRAETRWWTSPDALRQSACKRTRNVRGGGRESGKGGASRQRERCKKAVRGG